MTPTLPPSDSDTQPQTSHANQQAESVRGDPYLPRATVATRHERASGQPIELPQLQPSPYASEAGEQSDAVRQQPPGPPRARHWPPRRALLVLVLALVLSGIAAWLLRPAPAPGSLTASGTVEVDEVTLSAEAAGRIVELGVDEGSRVVAGQLVGRLSDPVLDVQLKQATVDAAQQQVFQAQLSRLELRAPLSGVVQKRIAHQGEFVAAGTPVLTVADPTTLKLTLYVPEADLGRVAVGQNVGIRADAFADRVFIGRVQTIGSHAEFTPRTVQTQKDRQNLVFGVTLRVPNPDGALKAGLPVDATFDQ